MTENDLLERVAVVAQAVVLAGLFWIGWQVRAMRAESHGELRRSGVLEWTVKKPEREAVKVTLDLFVGEDDAGWQRRLDEALRRAEKVR